LAHQSHRNAWIPAWALAISALLLGVAGYTAWRMGQIAREFADLRTRAAQEQLRSQALGAAQQPYQQGLRIVEATDTSKLILAGTNPNRPPVTVYWNSKMGLVLVADHLPAINAGRTLQLWSAPRKGAVSSVAIFRPDESGRLFVVSPSNAASNSPQALLVTEEPAGGSLRPTSPAEWTQTQP
jgi:hypothetical protein